MKPTTRRSRSGRAPRGAPPLALARLAALFGALSIAAPPRVAAAQDGAAIEGAQPTQPTKAVRHEAASRFKKGIELFTDGDYQAALIEFQRAYDLVPSYSVLYNIGQVQYQLQDYAGALSTLERYLAEGGRRVPAARRRDVEKDIQKLQGRISQVEISINVPGAELAVDDVPVGKGPFTKPVTVSAGRRKITASKEGYATQSRFVDLASNDRTKLTFELVERGDAQPAPPAEGPPAAPVPGDSDQGGPPPANAPASNVGAATPGAGSSSMPWAGWAATGAFAAGAVVFGVLALGASSDLQDQRAQLGASPDDLSDAAGKTTAFAVVSDVCMGATVIAGGLSLYLTVHRSSSGRGAAGGRSRGALQVGVAPSGVRVIGSF
jgi:hypothetical protein